MNADTINAQVNAMHVICGGIIDAAQDTDAMRWLRQNEAAMKSIRREMSAQRVIDSMKGEKA